MDKKQKPLKPGQLVTSYNHIYRVTKADKGILPCSLCNFIGCTNAALPSQMLFCNRAPIGCYFKLVK